MNVRRIALRTSLGTPLIHYARPQPWTTKFRQRTQRGENHWDVVRDLMAQIGSIPDAMERDFAVQDLRNGVPWDMQHALSFDQLPWGPRKTALSATPPEHQVDIDDPEAHQFLQDWLRWCYERDQQPSTPPRTSAAGTPSLEQFGTPDTGNGRWHYPHREFREYKDWGAGNGMHVWHIAPTDAPATEVHQDSFGGSHMYHLDPQRAHIEPDPDGFRPKVVPNNPNAITDFRNLPNPGGMLWRGMSHEEYEQAKKRGYFESNHSYNLGTEDGGYQADKTFFSTQLPSAAHYATGFAPWQYQPTFSRPAHVIGISDRPELPRGPMGEGGDSHEVGVPGQIPFDSVTHHWVGHAAAIRPGEMKNDYTHGQWGTPSRSLSPNVQVHWEPGEVPKRTTASHPIDDGPWHSAVWDDDLDDDDDEDGGYPVLPPDRHRGR